MISKYFQYRFSYVTVLTLPLVDFFYFILRYFVLFFILGDHVLFFSYFYLLFTCTSFCEIFFMCLFIYFVHGYIFISFLKFSHFLFEQHRIGFLFWIILCFIFCLLCMTCWFFKFFLFALLFFTVFLFFRVHSWVVFSFLFYSRISWWIHF